MQILLLFYAREISDILPNFAILFYLMQRANYNAFIIGFTWWIALSETHFPSNCLHRFETLQNRRHIKLYFIICVEPFRIRRVGFVAWLQIGLFLFFAVSLIFCSTLSVFRFFSCLSPAGNHAKIYIDGHQQQRDASASFDTLRPKRLDKQQFLSVFIRLCVAVWVCNGVCVCHLTAVTTAKPRV